MSETQRPLKVFLCHARADKQKVRELYRYLRKRGIQPWLDAEDLVGGQNWREEIPKAIKASDAIVICLSQNSINKEGFVQAEIAFALEKALDIPPGRIFIIPARFEDCEVPTSLERFHWVDLFEEEGFRKLMKSLRTRASQLERATVQVPESYEPVPNLAAEHATGSQQEAGATVSETGEGFDREIDEKAGHDVAKTKQEPRATKIVGLRETFSRSFNSYQHTVANANPLFKTVIIIGIVALLLWIGSLTIPNPLVFVPTGKTSLTAPTSPMLAVSVSAAPSASEIVNKTATAQTTITVTQPISSASSQTVPTPKPIVVRGGDVSIAQSFPAPGQAAEGLTWDGANLWLSDNSGMIFKVDSSGTVLDTFMSPEVTPQGITWDGSSFWIYTTNHSFIYQFQIVGQDIQKISSFQAPAEVIGGGITQDMAWDGQSLWYANQYNVTNLSPSGEILGSFIFEKNITGLDWDGTNLWFAYNGFPEKGTLFMVNTRGDVLGTYPSPIFQIICLAWADKTLWALGLDSIGGKPMIYKLQITTN